MIIKKCFNTHLSDTMKQFLDFHLVKEPRHQLCRNHCHSHTFHLNKQLLLHPLPSKNQCHIGNCLNKNHHDVCFDMNHLSKLYQNLDRHILNFGKSNQPRMFSSNRYYPIHKFPHMKDCLFCCKNSEKFKVSIKKMKFSSFFKTYTGFFISSDTDNFAIGIASVTVMVNVGNVDTTTVIVGNILYYFFTCEMNLKFN